MPNIFDHVINYVKSSVSAASGAEQGTGASASLAIKTWLNNSGYTPVGNVERVGDTTYGPAVSAVSRNPINFVKRFPDDTKQAGEFDNKSGVITINPYSATSIPQYGGVSNTIRHESMHSIMDDMSNRDAEWLANTQPGYQNIARRIGSTFSGPTWAEVPAQLAQKTTYGVSPQERDSYMSSFMDSLQALDPELAGKVDRLIGGVKTPKSK